MKNNLNIYILLYFQNTMHDKENNQAKIQKLGISTRRAQKYSGGNDFVLKRYRLEENRHFKDKNGEDFTYQSSLKKQENKQEQEIEQDLIIVPLQLPIQESLQQHQSPQKQEKKVNINDMVFVFDDDQQLKEESHNVQMIAENEKEKISSKNKDEMFNDITLKGSERENFSIAELMTPKHKKDSNSFNPRNISKKEIDKQQMKVIQRKLLKSIHKKRQISTTRLQSIQGVYIEQESKQNGISINIIDKKIFSISKLPSGIVLRCIIKRNSSFLNMLSPEYDLYLANGLKHIVSAKKYPMRNRELFKFSTDPVNFMDSSLLAVMHANINHNIYWLLDLPKKINGFDVSLLRLIIGYYRLKKDRQRKFSVLLPEMKDQYLLAIDYQQAFINFGNFKEEIDLQLNNLQQWEGQSKNSTKNFVIADQNDPDYRYLQMKKESDNVFDLVIQHPLSPLQAMAIAMTRFDVQLN